MIKMASLLVVILIGVSMSVCADSTKVVLVTTKGNIVIEVHEDKAPKTSAYFLDLIDSGKYNGATFYRSTDLHVKNGPRLIQGGILLKEIQGSNPKIMESKPYPVLETVETTSMTGIKHQKAVVSFARDLFDSGYVIPEIFICEGDFPMLDEGGRDQPDTKGFPAFAKVVQGMDVVAAISSGETAGQTGLEVLKGQVLTEPVVILEAYRQ